MTGRRCRPAGAKCRLVPRWLPALAALLLAPALWAESSFDRADEVKAAFIIPEGVHFSADSPVQSGQMLQAPDGEGMYGDIPIGSGERYQVDSVPEQ